ncbi:hypothetical protein ANN_01430 [Periplaneta americana]|uniref:Uncharacterized protein n=1 Tax=Periplaneta americana TaxID=6978 RepID=A0ABQ8TUM0_PERAM|nr:hypothetical protein ANN_01430 [Periplaneta americana]
MAAPFKRFEKLTLVKYNFTILLTLANENSFQDFASSGVTSQLIIAEDNYVKILVTKNSLAMEFPELQADVRKKVRPDLQFEVADLQNNNFVKSKHKNCVGLDVFKNIYFSKNPRDRSFATTIAAMFGSRSKFNATAFDSREECEDSFALHKNFVRCFFYLPYVDDTTKNWFALILYEFHFKNQVHVIKIKHKYKMKWEAVDRPNVEEKRETEKVEEKGESEKAVEKRETEKVEENRETKKVGEKRETCKGKRSLHRIVRIGRIARIGKRLSLL